jgi:hypothetical protein
MERTGNSISEIYPQQNESTAALKFVCWSLTERGAVGETLLHVCFLCGTEDHMLVVRRLLHYFPQLINDFYISDEYYGSCILFDIIIV